jgi:hypothetical protein
MSESLECGVCGFPFSATEDTCPRCTLSRVDVAEWKQRNPYTDPYRLLVAVHGFKWDPFAPRKEPFPEPANGDPLKETLQILEHKDELIKLVKFVAEQPDMRVAIDDIARNLDGKKSPAQLARHLNTIKGRYGRAKRFLLKKKAPLSLDRADNVISLVPMKY